MRLLPIVNRVRAKMGTGEDLRIPHLMAVIQATTATTLNPSPDKKGAVGKNTKWNWKLPEPPPTPLRAHNHL
jgi:hypothetical protein